MPSALQKSQMSSTLGMCLPNVLAELAQLDNVRTNLHQLLNISDLDLCDLSL